MKTLSERLKKAADLALLVPQSRLGHIEGVRISGPHKAIPGSTDPSVPLVYRAEAGGIMNEGTSADAALNNLTMSLREKAVVAQRALAQESMTRAGDALEIVSRIEKDEDLRDLMVASNPIPAPAPAQIVPVMPADPLPIRPDVQFTGKVSP